MAEEDDRLLSSQSVKQHLFCEEYKQVTGVLHLASRQDHLKAREV